MRLIVGCRSSDVENIREFADGLLDIDRFNELTYFQDRALLAPLNEVVQEINERMLAIFPGEEVEYLSSDSLAECKDVSEDFDPQLYSPDLLNGLKMSGMPNHRLVLKVGVPIMQLRNINHKKGLCNGTRIQVVSLGRRVIEAKVVSGMNIGYRTLISRLYVALSRVKSRDGIKSVILDKESKLTNKTTNVLYKNIFGNIE
ncbi:uncharacterized protein LOC143629669 [Bidens hawaiensis]|uniref:uncharacterized protein LOC143629669 n=1 Tax=Bidens hawaiensis TaxID=980011 RepID=UPI004048F285